MISSPPTADCPTVYYSADSAHEFAELSLCERVHQKHPTAHDVTVCYCFRHTPGSIAAELTSTGRSSVGQRVTAGIQSGQCACEIRNPQGMCWLGSVRAVVTRAQESLR